MLAYPQAGAKIETGPVYLFGAKSQKRQRIKWQGKKKGKGIGRS